MANSLGNSNAKRREVIVSLITAGKIHSQADVVKELKKIGLIVTQATASRDLREIGAMRAKTKDGEPRYILDSTHDLFSGSELVLSVAASGNTVVLRTKPAAAQFIASSLDAAISAADLQGAIGTIAGDDTVFVISQTATGGSALAKQISIIFGKDS